MPVTKTQERSARMGVVRVNLELSNYVDEQCVARGIMAPAEVRRCTVEAVVDTGASELVLPAKVARQLGLLKVSDVPVRYADGRRATRDLVGVVRVDLMGRSAFVTAIVEPGKRYALLGQIPLESMDLHVDCKHQRLLPNPDSPDAPLYEM